MSAKTLETKANFRRWITEKHTQTCWPPSLITDSTWWAYEHAQSCFSQKWSNPCISSGQHTRADPVDGCTDDPAIPDNTCVRYDCSTLHLPEVELARERCSISSSASATCHLWSVEELALRSWEWEIWPRPSPGTTLGSIHPAPHLSRHCWWSTGNSALRAWK